MHRKLPLVLTLTAWLFATGSQWDLVQSFAWARMFTDNVRTMSFEAAVARTFSPAGRCAMCRAVASAKQKENANQSPGGKIGGKSVLIYLPAPTVVIAAPDVTPFSPGEILYVGLGRAAPPLPPPRV